MITRMVTDFLILLFMSFGVSRLGNEVLNTSEWETWHAVLFYGLGGVCIYFVVRISIGAAPLYPR